MLFTSYSFLLFITIVIFLYFTLPKKFQWPFLLVVSYVFYAFADVKFLVYISITSISTYLCAYKIGLIKDKEEAYLKLNKETMDRAAKKAYKSDMKKKQKRFFLLCLLFNFGILAFAKYTNFMIDNINHLIGAFTNKGAIRFVDIALPLGISFYTFKTMSYLIDVYRGKYKPEKNVFKLMLFTSYFPQLIQGPISRYDYISKSLYASKSFNAERLQNGLMRILWGFFKKLVIADRLLIAVNTIVKNPDEYFGVYAFIGMVFYAIELYADFTGGIDITIGISEILGIHVEENFNRPYFSKNITDYWRRWHMTMGAWFREYLFYPISVSKPLMNLTKKAKKRFGNGVGRRVPIYIATLTVWFATGIWHGAHWNFIVWGLTNGIVIIASIECKPLYDKFHARFDVKGKFYYEGFQILRTFLLMSSIRMFDCYKDVPLTFKMFASMFTKWNYHEIFTSKGLSLGLTGYDYVVISIGIMVMLIVSMFNEDHQIRQKLNQQHVMKRYAVLYGLILSVLIFGAYGVGYDVSQFIYNQF